MTAPTAPERKSRQRPTRLSSLYVALIAAAVALILLVVFLFQNSDSVTVHLFNAEVQMPLALALLVAAITGALLVGLAGTARITQLRRGMRRAAREGNSHD